MANEEKMTTKERRNYLRLIWKRYLKADKLEGGRLPDGARAITGLHRHSLIRLMSAGLERKLRHKQRGPACGPELDDACQVISEGFDQARNASDRLRETDAPPQEQKKQLRTVRHTESQEREGIPVILSFRLGTARWPRQHLTTPGAVNGR